MYIRAIARVNTPSYGLDMKPRLTPDEWIKASFTALTAGGPQAIRAEPIARALKVSKGSFYWHFADVPALKKAMLDHWARAATQDVIDLVESKASSAKDRLRLLVQISTASNHDEYGGALAEAAIRDWARYDENAAKALKSVDQQRLIFVETQFRAHGTPKAQCRQNANILYAALIGLAHLSHHRFAPPSDDLPALLGRLLDA
jgi:AcrR family transcriptional regulator